MALAITLSHTKNPLCNARTTLTHLVMRVSGWSARVSEAAVVVLSWCCHEILIVSDEELTVRGVGCQGKSESGREEVLSARNLVWGEDAILSHTWPRLAIPQ